MEHRRVGFEASLRELKAQLLTMGSMVQHALSEAMAAFADGDVRRAEVVVEKDQLVNRLEQQIEDMAIGLIARQQPVAGDLRQIVSALRVAGDLERVGDLAVDVARAGVRACGRQVSVSLKPLLEMTSLVTQMLVDALAAYVEGRPELARSLARQDDEVDRRYRVWVESLFAVEASSSEAVTDAVTLAFVGRYLERIGDHATNVAEHAVYVLSGDRTDLN
ncbi:MAG: phosphate signaling complex protein PhoU [Alicyclobacillus herbarius]|uniref:phosphate signaling complex protein PhoU n=1 Tax=Alicyclobacillus herbarius TaxID=122960 RepID=UPI002354687A|nr:phosphate signaling complex protein PhoU [Alicyclobacillus herbarius]MCL6631410.1 phosphate signaling complex protein PhoU [Alicyclobacillus herbarius]